VRSEDPGYTPGSGFDMSVLQRKSDVISQCTQSVLCDPNINHDRMDDAVVDIYAINLQLGAMAVCTGRSLSLPSPKKVCNHPARCTIFCMP